MSSITVLQLISADDALQKSLDLHLMPFRIDYTGTAPISTYFRPKDAPPPNGELPETELASDSAGFAAAAQIETGKDADGASFKLHTYLTPNLASIDTMAADELAVAAAPGAVDLYSKTDFTSTPRLSLPSRHFTAAFRGRTVQGLRVDLPPGYGGAILCDPTESATTPAAPTAPTPVALETKATAVAGKAKKAAATAQAKTRRAARRSGRRGEPAIDEESEVAPMEVDEPPPTMDNSEAALDDVGDGTADEGGVRFLVPVATFSSFVLWNADVAVDAGKDEYLRTLTEWAVLAKEVRDCIVLFVE